MKVYKLKFYNFNDIKHIYFHEDINIIEEYGIDPYPETEIIFRTSLTKNQLFEVLDDLPESHIAKQTLALKKEYTGLTNYQLN